MGRPPRRVDGRVADAEAARKRSAARLQVASKARLAELLRVAPRDRFVHIDDPALVLEDRKALRRSIEEAFRRPRKPARRRWQPGRLLRRLRGMAFRAALEPLVLCPVLIVATCAGMAWHNTATLVRLNQDITFTNHSPLGDQEGRYHQGDVVGVLLDRQGGGVLRTWYPGIGYLRIPVPPGSFTLLQDTALRAAPQARPD